MVIPESSSEGKTACFLLRFFPDLLFLFLLPEPACHFFPIFPIFSIFFGKPLLALLFLTSTSMVSLTTTWPPTSLAVSMKLLSSQKRGPPILPKKRKTPFLGWWQLNKIKITPWSCKKGSTMRFYNFTFSF